jgi:3-oxoacyl-[acyl-carrier protein] reductase
MVSRYEILENRNCFITGATGGLGRCIAMKMAEKKCNLFLTSTNIIKLENLKKEIEYQYGCGNKIYYGLGDLNKNNDVNKIIAMARESIGAIDILVNCAGLFVVKPIFDSNIDDYDKTMNLNIRAPFMFCREFSQDMIKNRWGRIINIGSSSAYVGSRDTSLYCASKHALLGFSRALHDELKKNGIRTFCVSPSGLKTEMGKLIRNQNYDTFLNPDEVAEYVAFICSFDGEMISDEVRLNRMVIE